MLIDSVNIKVESGKGGRGSFATFALKPNGGDGGNGGDVYLKGNAMIYDLRSFDDKKKYKAEDGEDGMKKGLKGADAPDYIIQVPLTTEVYNGENLLGVVSKDGQMLKVLSGGKGAYGNLSIGRDESRRRMESQRENETVKLRFQLKLSSDVIFLGYPNAGKSSMLNELTRASAKTAPYAFTTIDPQVAIMDGIKLMDLPGLIDGTYAGKGLGTNFLNHVENSRLAIHFVGLDNESPLKSYLDLREEVKRISDTLFNLPEIVVLTKSDEKDEKYISSIVNDFKKKKIEPLVVSIIDEESLRLLKEVIKSRLGKK